MSDRTEIQLDPDLDGIATKLKKAFAEAKTAQQGAKYRPHERFRKIELWYAVARKCQELKADPDDLIEAAFTFCSVPGGPYPQNLPTRAMDRWYSEFLRVHGGKPKEGQTVAAYRLGARIQEAFSTTMQIAKANNRRIRDILLDETSMRLDLCPAYIRVLLLPADPGIVAKWGAKARSEVLTNPRLFETLKASTFDLSWLE